MNKYYIEFGILLISNQKAAMFVCLIPKTWLLTIFGRKISALHHTVRILTMMTMYRVAELERLRWPITMALLGVFSLFCLLLFIGAIVHR